MTTIAKIKQSTALQFELSEMLFKALGLGCWHKWKFIGRQYETYRCSNCNETLKLPFDTRFPEDYCWECEVNVYLRNPNLFSSDWQGFGVVWEAVNDDQGFIQNFSYNNYLNAIEYRFIIPPHFQLEVLKWLVGADKVEKVVKGGEND